MSYTLHSDSNVFALLNFFCIARLARDVKCEVQVKNMREISVPLAELYGRDIYVVDEWKYIQISFCWIDYSIIGAEACDMFGHILHLLWT